MKSILLTVAMLVTTLTAAGQWVKPTVESKGDFVVGDTVYLYNTGAQMFLTQGNAYGTQASVADEGLMLNGDLTDEMKANLSSATQLAVDYADGRSTLEVIAKIREAMDEASSYLTGIDQHPATAQTATVAAIYNLKGMRLNALQKGVNIVRMSDNTIKKVMVK